jgi:hypothetical protein
MFARSLLFLALDKIPLVQELAPDGQGGNHASEGLVLINDAQTYGLDVGKGRRQSEYLRLLGLELHRGDSQNRTLIIQRISAHIQKGCRFYFRIDNRRNPTRPKRWPELAGVRVSRTTGNVDTLRHPIG